MTKSGIRALRRFARAQGWTKIKLLEEATRIDRIADQFIAEDPHVKECDRDWLETAIRAPSSAQILFTLHYRGAGPHQTIH